MSIYLTAFEAMGAPEVSVVGPAYAGGDASCLDGASTWGVERYQAVTDATAGVYLPLTLRASDCAPADIATIAAELADALAD